MGPSVPSARQTHGESFQEKGDTLRVHFSTPRVISKAVSPGETPLGMLSSSTPVTEAGSLGEDASSRAGGNTSAGLQLCEEGRAHLPVGARAC